MARTQTSVNPTTQLAAKTADKASRIDEAGIRSRRRGNLSATTRRAEGERDAKAAAAMESVAEKASASPRSTASATAKRPAASPRAAKARGDAPTPRSRRAGRAMMVQVNTSGRVAGHAKFVAGADESIRAALDRFSTRLTRVEAHFDDVNAGKGGADDKRCTIEARPTAMQPVSATATAATPAQALRGTLSKLKRLLTTRLAKRGRE